MAEKKYIELEALMNVPIRRDHYDKKNGDVNFINGIEFVLEYAEYLPAADVEPVRHGHWNIGYFHDRVCSCCLHPDNDLNDCAHDYCPNCGAKMKE